MSEPLSIVHVIRPRPPWRHAAHDLTECGLRPSENKSITRDEFTERYRTLGRERTAMLTCMTCMTTWERYGGGGRYEAPATWEDDPVAAIARESEKARWAKRRSATRERLDVELRAIITLVEAHRDEFDAIVSRMEWRKERDAEREINAQAKRAAKK